MKRIINKIFNIKREPKPGPIHTCDEKHAGIDFLNKLSMVCSERGIIDLQQECEDCGSDIVEGKKCIGCELGQDR